MSDNPTPDFAMLRAVEILAGIYERNRKPPSELPPISDKPIVLFNESIALETGVTTRERVERALGIGFSYPARGWHTYCVRGAGGKREFLSIFYHDRSLISAELYYPKVDRAPRLEPLDLPFRFVPGELSLGQSITTLPEHFGRISEAAEAMGAYGEMFGARFPGGSAYVMGNGGRIERLAIYVLSDEPRA